MEVALAFSELKLFSDELLEGCFTNQPVMSRLEKAENVCYWTSVLLKPEIHFYALGSSSLQLFFLR